MMGCKHLAVAGMVGALFAGSAQADVYITEAFPGGISGAERTSDWFELTNFGDTAVDIDRWTYDDGSADPDKLGFLAGTNGTIEPGESVVFLASWHDDWAKNPQSAIDAFTDFWGSSNLGDTQIGYVTNAEGEGGGGMSGGGEDIYVFDGYTSDANLVDYREYLEGRQNTWVVDPANPAGSVIVDGEGIDRKFFDTEAQDGVWGGFLSVQNATDEINEPSAGSPGVVPEPASLALLGAGGLVLTLRRRRHA